MLIALPNLDGSFTCTLFLPFEGEISFSQLDTPLVVLDFFEKWFPDVSFLIPDLAEQFFSNSTSSLVTIKCSPWQKNNNTMLIGDAAHAIVPFYGQGMVSGFEDCYLFDELIEKHNGELSHVLSEFSNSRKIDGDAIADLALANFTEMSSKIADPQFLLRKKIEARIHELYPDLWTPQYSLVTFTSIPYSEAYRIGERQKRIMNDIMQLSGVNLDWEKIDLLPYIMKL